MFQKVSKNTDQRVLIINEWEEAFNTMQEVGYFQGALPWRVWPTARNNGVLPCAQPQLTANSNEFDISAVVPSVLHENWSAKDRERAEVLYPCGMQLYTHRVSVDVRFVAGSCKRSQRRTKMLYI